MKSLDTHKTVKDWLETAQLHLHSAGITTARLDALVLLEDAAGKDRSWLLAHPEHVLEDQTVSLLNQQIQRRANHEPLAYIRGKSEFYGREFLVSPDTLEPRPETETILHNLNHLLNQKRLHRVQPGAVVDVGTGSGCLAISAKLEWPELTVHATEISSPALAIAQQNAVKLGAEVQFYEGNLLGPIQDQAFDIIVCNLPYVPDSHTINQAAMQEPKLAIFGGEDGLDLYRELFDQVKILETKPAHILTESLPFQHEELAKIAVQAKYSLEKTDDFIQVFGRS